MIGERFTSRSRKTGPVANVRFSRPQRELVAFISTYYSVEISGSAGSEIEDFIQPEWGELRFHSGGDSNVAAREGRFATRPAAALFGPTSRVRLIHGRPGVLTAISFTPQGWAHLVRVNAAILADKFVAAASILSGIGTLDAALAGVSDDEARVQLLDAYFCARSAAGPPCDPRIGVVAAAVNAAGDVKVRELAHRVGMTTTQLTRGAQRWFGFPTKTLLRRQRFVRTLALLHQSNGRSIGRIVDESYYDQSHFNREFRYFMGMSPRTYFLRSRQPPMGLSTAIISNSAPGDAGGSAWH
ncbi:MAG: hypothetical protein BGN95_09685 [Sphingomonas sp. 66-10]|uniref:helix-turn-helix domain-containing protein n=1 Tax=Sphingomonas sp. 66-10 TaxID=1895848 RepID=UPI0009283852|nr:helix-turn-helix domain-containing protein [Sphingomonas sp. 66-10]OJU22385.1 MAG: hypothetical protein BGN95_09685 [Sphingomonas sp. 66-10]